MDNMTRVIADYASSLTFAEVPDEVVRAAKQRMVDSLACAIAAYECEPARIGRRLARGAIPERYVGRILGFGERTTAQDAAFVNTAMIRNLDFNDQYPGGHPSDCLGAFLAIAESEAAVGEVINIGTGCEIPIRILVEKIHKLTDSRSRLRIGKIPYRPTEIWRMAAKNKKAKELLGWSPKVSFDYGLLKTIAWYRKFNYLFSDLNSPLYRLCRETD